MKTISEISKELGISVQAVHKRIKKMLANPDYKKEISASIQKDMKGKMYLDEKGVLILKSMHQPDSTTVSTDNLNSTTGLSKQFKPDANASNVANDSDKYLDYNQPNNYSDKLISTVGLNHNNHFLKDEVEIVDDSLNSDEKLVDGQTNCISNNQHKNKISTGLSNAVDTVDEVEHKRSFNDLYGLKKRIEEQEKEIKRLNEELSKERNHSREQSNRILALAEQMTELTRNNQVLLKQEQDRSAKILLLEEEKNSAKSRNGFLSRFFNKNCDEN